LALNPGAILGARFPGGKREDTAPTFLTLEVETGKVQGYEVAQNNEVVKRLDPV
jgi:hypothetical protein